MQFYHSGSQAGAPTYGEVCRRCVVGRCWCSADDLAGRACGGAEPLLTSASQGVKIAA